GARLTAGIPGAGGGQVAASDRCARRLQELQTELQAGPSLASYRTGRPVAVPDVGTDEGFATFALRAAVLGVGGVFAFPLPHDGELVGTLDLYRNTPGPLDATTMDAAGTL